MARRETYFNKSQTKRLHDGERDVVLNPDDRKAREALEDTCRLGMSYDPLSPLGYVAGRRVA